MRVYPRRFAIVEHGETTEVVVADPAHEMAVTLSHPEAMGLTGSDQPDYSWLVIEKAGDASDGDA